MNSFETNATPPSEEKILGLQDPGMTDTDRETIRQAARDVLQYSRPRNAAEFYVRSRITGKDMAWEDAPRLWEETKKRASARMEQNAADLSRAAGAGPRDITPASEDPNPTQIFRKDLRSGWPNQERK